MVFGLNNSFTLSLIINNGVGNRLPYPKKPQRKKRRKAKRTKTFLFYKYPLLFSCYITLPCTKTFIPYFRWKTIKGVIIFATIVNHSSGWFSGWWSGLVIPWQPFMTRFPVDRRIVFIFKLKRFRYHFGSLFYLKKSLYICVCVMGMKDLNPSSPHKS